MRIDAHHHLWRYRPADFGWIEPKSRIAQDYGADYLLAAMATTKVDSAIAVQARQTHDETVFLLDAAERCPQIVGVVGWIDLRADDIEERIAARPIGPLVGYRHVVQDEADPDFLLGDAFVAGVRAVLRHDLSYDLLVTEPQLAQVPRFVARVGEGRLILDHAAKPAIGRGAWQPWADRIAEAAANCPTLYCKVSGLVTEADHARWQFADFERYLGHLLECFGPERLIWGSDWPVCELAAPYAATFEIVDCFVRRQCPSAAADIFGRNAERAYHLATA